MNHTPASPATVTLHSSPALTPSLDHAQAYLAALGALETPQEFRAIHETDRARPAIPRRGKLADLWSELCDWNARGYGIYVTPAALDGQGRELANVQTLRAHYVDLDSASAAISLANARAWHPAPHMVVNSSPGKHHVYWLIDPHADTERFTIVQRKLVTQFASDPSIIDATRVMRLPGTLHRKGAPWLVTVEAGPAWGTAPTSTDLLDIALHGIEPAQGGHGGARRPIGEGEQAPSYDHALQALNTIAVEQLTDRNEWLAVTGAFMQAVPPEQMERAQADWMAWGVGYPGRDETADLREWADLLKRGTSVRGWGRLHSEAYGAAPGARPEDLFGGQVAPSVGGGVPDTHAVNGTHVLDLGSTLFTSEECAQYFRDCILISSENRILCADNVFRDSSAFNSRFGGKKFQIGTGEETSGHMTDEPWKAATRSRLWTVPQVQFTCFRPDLDQRVIVTDELGREYVNMYRPARITRREGDATPFIEHMTKILPVESDRNMFLAYLAHNLKYPGHKIFWAPLIQSAEGIGKNAIKRVMQHGIGRMYFYQPKARDLVESGSKFNGWQENKLFFLVDEVRTDERRDMVEVLKPFITETEMEIQGKGKDQRMGDTPGNWLFFSNWRDAIPITLNGRRHAIYYSALQSADDILSTGMDKGYFDRLYGWLDTGGVEIVTDWLMRWDIERGGMPVRAPETSSTREALRESFGPVAQVLLENIEAAAPGFRNGWISTSAAHRAMREAGRRPVPGRTLGAAISEIGYSRIGQASVTFFQDDPQNSGKRAVLWNKDPNVNVSRYAEDQGFM